MHSSGSKASMVFGHFDSMMAQAIRQDTHNHAYSKNSTQVHVLFFSQLCLCNFHPATWCSLQQYRIATFLQPPHILRFVPPFPQCSHQPSFSLFCQRSQTRLAQRINLASISLLSISMYDAPWPTSIRLLQILPIEET